MLDIAKDRLKEQAFSTDVTVKFELRDATKCEFNENTFDVIYSRDCILHIYDKLGLFKSFNKWLKPEEFYLLLIIVTNHHTGGFSNIFTR